MKKCQDCKSYFYDRDLEEGSCLKCRFPWASEENFPVGVNFPNGPPSYLDLLEKTQVSVSRMKVILPFAHNPQNYYVEAEIYEGPGRYWYIEGRDSKFKSSREALVEAVKTADAKRLKMLNQEFEELFGNQ